MLPNSEFKNGFHQSIISSKIALKLVSATWVAAFHQQQSLFSPPNKGAHEWRTISHLMCNNTAEEPIKKKKKNIQLHFYKPQ